MTQKIQGIVLSETGNPQKKEVQLKLAEGKKLQCDQDVEEMKNLVN